MSRVTVTISGPVGSGKSAIAGEIEIALRATGVPVTHADPVAARSEQRMTHADWQAAIEMYRPDVVLEEVMDADPPFILSTAHLSDEERADLSAKLQEHMRSSRGVALSVLEPQIYPTEAEIRRRLADLVARYYMRVIGESMRQAENWAAKGRPFAVHHRLHSAQAKYQIVSLMQRAAQWGTDPFAAMERVLEQPPARPPGAWPWSRQMHDRFWDPRSAVRELEGLDDSRVHRAPPFPTQKGLQFLAKDSDGQWHYVNHAGEWQTCPPPIADHEP